MGDKAQSRRTDPASKAPRLVDLRAFAPFQPLLRALAGRSPDDFFARMTVLQILAEGRHSVFTPRDLGGPMPWVDGRARFAIVRALRAGGWVEEDPETGGLVLTDTGRRAYALLLDLLRDDRSGATAPQTRSTSGLTADEVTTIRDRSLGELAAAGREALLPVFPPLPLLSTDVMAQAADRVLSLESEPPQRR